VLIFIPDRLAQLKADQVHVKEPVQRLQAAPNRPL